MPDGYRRGGSYTRNGRTFQRRGTKIRAPKRAALIGLGVVALGSVLVGGTPLLAHPVVLTGVLCLGAAIIASPAIWRATKRHGKRWAKTSFRKAKRAGYRKVQQRQRQRARTRQPVVSRVPARPAPSRGQSKPIRVPTAPTQPELWGPPERGSSRLLS